MTSCPGSVVPPNSEANPLDQLVEGGGPSFGRLKSSRIPVVGKSGGGGLALGLLLGDAEALGLELSDDEGLAEALALGLAEGEAEGLALTDDCSGLVGNQRGLGKRNHLLRL